MDAVLLTKEKIDQCFEAPDQHKVWENLYRLVYPEFDRIAHINGYPAVGEKTHKYIFAKFIQFDKAHHPEVMAGGLWMNSGFGCDRSLVEWVVVPAPVEWNADA